MKLKLKLDQQPSVHTYYGAHAPPPHHAHTDPRKHAPAEQQTCMLAEASRERHHDPPPVHCSSQVPSDCARWLRKRGGLKQGARARPGKKRGGNRRAGTPPRAHAHIHRHTHMHIMSRPVLCSFLAAAVVSAGVGAARADNSTANNDTAADAGSQPGSSAASGNGTAGMALPTNGTNTPPVFETLGYGFGNRTVVDDFSCSADSARAKVLVSPRSCVPARTESGLHWLRCNWASAGGCRRVRLSTGTGVQGCTAASHACRRARTRTHTPKQTHPPRTRSPHPTPPPLLVFTGP